MDSGIPRCLLWAIRKMEMQRSCASGYMNPSFHRELKKVCKNVLNWTQSLLPDTLSPEKSQKQVSWGKLKLQQKDSA